MYLAYFTIFSNRYFENAADIMCINISFSKVI